MRFIKNIPYLFGFVIIFLAFLSTFSTSVSAQASTDTASAFASYSINDQPVGDNPELWADHKLDYKYKDCVGDKCTQGLRIDQTVPNIKIQFTGLKANTDYYLCGQSDVKDCTIVNSEEAVGKKFKSDGQGNITLEACGGGTDWTKGAGIDGTTGTLEEACDGKDYFHEGQTYHVSVFPNKTGLSSVVTAEFFTKHSYPIVKVAPGSGTNVPVTVTLWGRRPGGNNDNNYQVIVEGQDNGYKKEFCFTTKDGSGQTVGIHSQGIDLDTKKVIPEHILTGTGWEGIAGSVAGETKTFTRGEANGLGVGSYLLKINERKSDNRPLGIAETCEGGHSYIYIYFRIDKKANPITITKVEYDPNNSDWDDLQDTIGTTQFPPCAKDKLDKVSGTCTELDTAIGNIPTTIEGFITSIFKFVLTIASFGATILIIYAGYIFMTSRGDKEKIAGARETLTAAIVGLLFIVLSVVILEIIGVDILKIPGITR